MHIVMSLLMNVNCQVKMKILLVKIWGASHDKESVGRT
jgi:hypothetical protein